MALAAEPVAGEDAVAELAVPAGDGELGETAVAEPEVLGELRDRSNLAATTSPAPKIPQPTTACLVTSRCVIINIGFVTISLRPQVSFSSRPGSSISGI